MGRLAQYRLLKKVKKMLDTPAKTEKLYDVSLVSMYIGDKSSCSENYESNPNHNLRRTQINEIALMLHRQMDNMEEPLQGGSHDALCRDKNTITIQEAFVDIAVAFLELDRAMLFTETEKMVQRRQHASRLGVKQELRPDASCRDSDLLARMRGELQDWKSEVTQRQRKVGRVETTIRDLGLNVNDVRCAQILSEKKRATAALEVVVSEGARLCRHVYQKLQGVYNVG